jgi:hypothetical protein
MSVCVYSVFVLFCVTYHADNALAPSQPESVSPATNVLTFTALSTLSSSNLIIPASKG